MTTHGTGPPGNDAGPDPGTGAEQDGEHRPRRIVTPTVTLAPDGAERPGLRCCAYCGQPVTVPNRAQRRANRRTYGYEPVSVIPHMIWCPASLDGGRRGGGRRG